MQEITKNELEHCIGGGFTLSGTLMNSLIRGASVIMEIGRSLGTAIRRWRSNALCSF